MKNIKCLITSLVLALGVGAAVGAVADRKAEVKVAEAATNSVTLASSENGWSTTAEPLTLNGDYWTIQKTFAVDVTFKVVVNGSDWVGDGDGVSWCSGMGSEGKGQNFKVLTAGTYIIKAAKTIGDYGDKSYGIVFENAVKYTVTKYKVLNGASPVSIENEQVGAGTNYAVPANRYEAGYTFGGWYTNEACTSAYSERAINANTNLYAKYTSGTWAGTITVDFANSYFSDAAANYAVYFYDETTYPSKVEGWSTYLTGVSSKDRLVEISYNVPFEPKNMIVVRYDSTYSSSDWANDKWAESHAGKKWGQTGDLSYASMVVFGTESEHYDNAYTGNVRVLGGPSGGAWSELASLNSVKRKDNAGSKEVEHFSTTVSLTAGKAFKIVTPDDVYHGDYDTHDSLNTGYFSGGGSDDINVLKSGTYAFYYNTVTNRLYITTVDIAAADEWAQYFLSHVNCDATGKTAPSGWSACATEYAKLSGGAKDIIYGAKAKEDGSYVEQAVARYDVALKNHPSLDPFIKNSSNVARSASVIKNNIIAESTDFINYAIIAASGALILVEVSFLLLKRRKKNI